MRVISFAVIASRITSASGKTANSSMGFTKSKTLNILNTLGPSCIPAPTSLNRSACSKTVTSNFFCASASAAARPPSPPPTIIIFDRVILFVTISFLDCHPCFTKLRLFNLDTYLVPRTIFLSFSRS